MAFVIKKICIKWLSFCPAIH